MVNIFAVYANITSNTVNFAIGNSTVKRLLGVATPIDPTDGVNKAYVDSSVGGNQTLAEVLGFGNTTDGYDIYLTDSGEIIGETAAGRGGDAVIRGGEGLSLGAGDVILYGGIPFTDRDGGSIILNATSADGIGTSGSIEIYSANSTATAGSAAGNILVQAGAGISTNPAGNISLLGQSSPGSTGTVITLTAGNSESGTAGDVNINAGNISNTGGSSTGTAGNIALTAGNVEDIAGTSVGSVSIMAGASNAVGSNLDGGSVSISAGAGESAGFGGWVFVVGGAGDGGGGGVSLSGGYSADVGGGISVTAGGGDNAGGGVNISAGSSDIAGGGVAIIAGSSAVSGGNINLTAGNGDSTLGGNIQFTAGESSSAISGDIIFNAVNGGTVNGSVIVAGTGTIMFYEVSDHARTLNAGESALWTNTSSRLIFTDDSNVDHDLLSGAGIDVYETNVPASGTENVIVHTISANDQTVAVNCIVVGRSGGDESAAFSIFGLFEDISGTLTQIGSTSVISNIKDTVGWDATFAVVGSDVTVAVTNGDTVNTADFHITGTATEQT